MTCVQMGSSGDIDVERPRLRALAYRMLGTVADAEDVVQEGFARFYRLPSQQREEIRNPGAWLMRVVGRLALDELKSARARRVDYVGEWLPEPVPVDSEYAGDRADPADIVSTGDAISQALLMLLESLSPAERAVYVLRESFALPYDEIADMVGRSPGACRQLLVTARRHLQANSPSGAVSRALHDDVVRAFAEACERGDVSALTQLLDPSVTVRSDGGGKVSAARRPVVGLDNVARLLIGLRTKYPQAHAELAEVPGAHGVVMVLHDDVAGVMTCAVGPSGISDIWIMRNPDKLTLWGQPAR